ncbi:MAG TPA: FimV/HubP family polar landmark protein, partial [Nevskiaceae bacterium]|nr:FimV/HubP family polar landmark protein [Nevskiaceae bacterium]
SQAPVKRPPEPSLLSRLLPVFIALIVIAIALVIWRTWRERRATREYEQAARAAAAPPLARSTVSAMPKPMSARDELEDINRRIDEDATRADANRTVVAGKSESDFETVAASTGKIPPYTGPVGGRPEPEVADQFSNTTQIDLGANDPIAEADFHLAYGLYEEAALLLRQAAEREPGRTDVRTKLAETYFAAGKPAEFKEVAEGLKGQLNQEDWGKLAIMGRQLAPDSPLFAGAGNVAVDLAFDEPAENETVAAATKARVDDGLDFSLEELELPGKGKPGAKGDQPPLEFDLGEFDLAGTTKTTRPAPKTTNVQNVGELSLKDFDLADSKQGDRARGGLDIRLEDVHPDAGLEDPLGDTISAGDDVATKLDLARAYVEMGDSAMARTLLDEVATQGNDDQKREAAQLRERLLG